MKPHFGYLMVFTKKWYGYFLSRWTLGLATVIYSYYHYLISLRQSLQSFEGFERYGDPESKIMKNLFSYYPNPSQIYFLSVAGRQVFSTASSFELVRVACRYISLGQSCFYFL